MRSRINPGIVLAAALAWTLCVYADPPHGYKLAWADEFSGASLDTDNWVWRTDSKHWSTQRRENVSVANGQLVLTLKKEQAGGMQYTGAGVISKRSFRFGYYESRFRVDAARGWHTSFWMMRHDGSGSTNTNATDLELDAIENDSVDLNSYSVNVHKWPGEHKSYGHKKVAVENLSVFHVFGCEYTSTQVTYYLDGKVVQTVDVGALPHGDLHVWLTSIASHLGNTDSVSDTGLPGHVYYDYVRFYQKSN